MIWPFNRTKPTPILVIPVYRETSEFTVSEWRTIPDMVKRAKAVLGNADTKAMLDACKNSRLGLYAIDGMPDISVRAIVQAQAEGYASAIADFQLLGVFKEPKQQISETWEPPELNQ